MAKKEDETETLSFKVELDQPKKSVKKKAKKAAPVEKRVRVNKSTRTSQNKRVRGKWAKDEKLEKKRAKAAFDHRASNAKRVIAGVLDLGVCVGAVYGAQKTLPMSFLSKFPAVTFLTEEVGLAIKTQYITLAVMGVLSFFVFYLLVEMLLRGSLGKQVFRLYIAEGLRRDKPASIILLFIRTFILKPISILLLVGPVMIFMNSERKALHDILGGTSVSRKR